MPSSFIQRKQGPVSCQLRFEGCLALPSVGISYCGLIFELKSSSASACLRPFVIARSETTKQSRGMYVAKSLSLDARLRSVDKRRSTVYD